MVLLWRFSDVTEKLAALYDVPLKRLSDGHIHCIGSEYIVGLKIPINSHISVEICRDKAATDAILELHGVPRVLTYLVYDRGNGVWKQLLGLTQKFPEMVMKPVDGSRGNHVYRIRSVSELEQAWDSLSNSIPYNKTPKCIVSPFIAAISEYRLLILRNKVRFCIKKLPPANGWKHNLSSGATSVVVCLKEADQALLNVGIRACKAIGVSFAAVDLLHCDSGSSYRVLEVNSAFGVQNLVQQHQHIYNDMMNLYSEALSLFLKCPFIPFSPTYPKI